MEPVGGKGNVLETSDNDPRHPSARSVTRPAYESHTLISTCKQTSSQRYLKQVENDSLSLGVVTVLTGTTRRKKA